MMRTASYSVFSSSSEIALTCARAHACLGNHSAPQLLRGAVFSSSSEIALTCACAQACLFRHSAVKHSCTGETLFQRSQQARSVHRSNKM